MRILAWHVHGSWMTAFVHSRHEVIVPVTGGALDLGPWQRVFYGEWDGQRAKRVVIKAMGV